MSNIAVRVENLGKMYRIGGPQEAYSTFRDAITHTVSVPFKRAYDLLRGQAYGAAGLREEIWALKEVSFEVKHGEVVGIIGHNGAGKSTLLKILSRITEPTEGYVDIFGRIGALLEVGTGFHPELTGRENIYLNGAVLGMSRTEIRRKFDEIVDFSGVEKFIDTPVKHYSSGMGLRLGFAVAVHLEPEILVIDEVLAVGDAEFQKKCLTKMQEVSYSGRTILFVSHNMSAIRNICTKCIILDHGAISGQGEVNRVTDLYLSTISIVGMEHKAVESRNFVIHSVEITSTASPVIKTFDTVHITVVFTPKINVDDPGLYVGILTSDGQRLAGIDFKDFATTPIIKAGQRTKLGFIIDKFPFLPGNYQIEVHLKDMQKHLFELIPQMYPFEIVETPVYGGRHLDSWFGSVGLVAQAVDKNTAVNI